MPHSFKNNPYIIAEVGACHDGSMTNALVAIDMATLSGADAVKFQVYDADRLSARRKAGAYRDVYARYQLPHAWLSGLKIMAQKCDLDLVLSVYDEHDLASAAPYADVLKVSSFEAGDLSLIQSCQKTGKPVIVSTGLTSEEEIINLHSLSDIYVLHCVSAYPTQMKDLCLETIEAYGLDGFSDHSANVLTGAFAVGHGASIIEVHLKLHSTNLHNPDYPHSLNPTQLREYIKNARLAKLASGEARENVLPCEAACAPFKVQINKEGA